ncbi:MAG: undecaprenyl-diphosphate phosphatase [Candidatus Paceibacterota bacterium]|jgi:undecaprenyl-diphosphatase
MNTSQAIILSVVQGITEFLPISSSGHLAVLQIFWQIPDPSVVFSALLHFGTLGAILIVFYQEIIKILQKRNWKLIKLIIIGTIPAAIFGFFFQSIIEAQFSSLKFIGFSFLITALFLILTKFLKINPKYLNIEDLTYFDALIIGIAQTAALFPGISRSGLTISTGLLRKLKPEIAYKFSFLLAVPVILGAFVLQIPNLIQQGQNNYLIYVIGALVSLLTGIISLKILEKILKKGKLYWFSLYLIIISMIILI